MTIQLFLEREMPRELAAALYLLNEKVVKMRDVITYREGKKRIWKLIVYNTTENSSYQPEVNRP